MQVQTQSIKTMLQSTQWVVNTFNRTKTKTKPGFFPHRAHALLDVSMDSMMHLVCSRCYILAIISMKSHRVLEPARLMVQVVQLWHQTNSNHSPHSRVDDCYLQKRTSTRAHTRAHTEGEMNPTNFASQAPPVLNTNVLTGSKVVFCPAAFHFSEIKYLCFNSIILWRIMQI